MILSSTETSERGRTTASVGGCMLDGLLFSTGFVGLAYDNRTERAGDAGGATTTAATIALCVVRSILDRVAMMIENDWMVR